MTTVVSEPSTVATASTITESCASWRTAMATPPIQVAGAVAMYARAIVSTRWT